MPITVDTSLPLADTREGWDGDAAGGRVLDFCSDQGQLHSDCAGKAFLWRDPDEDETNRTSYKFPVADVINGRLQLVWPGVAAAANVLSGGRGGTNIPESDQEKMRAKVKTLYNRFADKFDDDSIQVPWENNSTTSSASVKEPESASDTDMESMSASIRLQSEDTNPDGVQETSSQTSSNDSGCQCRNSNDTASPATHVDIEPVKASAGSAHKRKNKIIVASASDNQRWYPPHEYFMNPGFDQPVKMRVDGDRIYGHLAPWKQYHISSNGQKIYPPRDPDGLYRAFRQSEIKTDDGFVDVGLLTMNTGHPDLHWDDKSTVSHYDNTGTMVAAINVGEDDIGIWFSGIVLPDIDENDRRRLELGRVSGDWRVVDDSNRVQLVAALVVNTPGFPVMKSNEELNDRRHLALAASAFSGDHMVSLVAAGAFDVDADDGADKIAQMVVDKLDERERADREMKADEDRNQRAMAASAELNGSVRRRRARDAAALLSSARGTSV